MPDLDPFRRHDLVRLVADWREHLVAAIDEAAAAAVARRVALDGHFVVARRDAGDAADVLRLGLALPGKRRIAIAATRSVVRERRDPLRFDEVAATIDGLWPEAGPDLRRLAERRLPGVRVFGSLAWQVLATPRSERHATTASDVDLLFAPATRRDLAGAVAALRDFEARRPVPRLDGEVRLPDGGFVAWRELAAEPPLVLVKGSAGATLRRFSEIAALFTAEVS